MTSGAAILITIPLSHYCEKVRWALDRVAFPYREAPYAPLLHRFATHRYGGGTVPVLVHGDQRLIDSTAMLIYADQFCGGDLLYPRNTEQRLEVDALEEQFDTQLGPNTRRWAYAQLLSQPRLLRSIWSRGVPRFQVRLISLIAPIAQRLVRAGYKITPESSERSLRRVRDVFREVDLRLSDGRQFLVGDRFTAADLTFASLAAPVLFPVEYRAIHPGLEAIDDEMREVVLNLRDTDAGRFALRMFFQERGRSCVYDPVVLPLQQGGSNRH